MASVDSRIVTMKFDNTDFERRASQTMTTLQRLKQSLSFSGASKGLDSVSSTLGKFGRLNPFAPLQKAFGAFSGMLGKFGLRNPFAPLQRSFGTFSGMLGKFGLKNPFTGAQKGVTELQNATNRFSMGHVEGAVTGVSKKFIALTTIGVTALSTIASKAISSGAQMLKSITLAPIMDGFHEYETNLNSIQTVLANTKDQGTNLSDVNKALNQLNTYSDKTIYNFSEMARNIGTFTAAGVDLKTSVASIKGIANLAAISGSNSQQASTAMYQLSQAISAGRVGLQDWNSVVNAGMGGAVFQKALARTASVMGTVGSNAVKTSGPMHKLTINGKSFRESITAKPGEKSWLTSDVLTNTLKQFSGDMTTADLKAQGFNASQIKAIQSMGKMGQEAATKVKTLSQLMSTLKEGVGSGWAKTWQIVFGNFNEAKTTFTNVSNTLGKFITTSANARNKVLGDWKALGGRTVLIQAISNTFHALIGIIKPIHDAFRDIFPAATGKSLYDLTVKLKNFTAGLQIGSTTSENLKRTFRGVFAVFDIAKQLIGGAIGMFVHLFGVVGSGSGSFLNFTGGVGDFLVSLDQAIKKSGTFKSFFTGLGSILSVPIKLLGRLASVLAGLFTGLNPGAMDKVSSSFDNAGKRLSPIAAMADRIRSAFSGLGPFLANIGAQIGKAFGAIGDALVNAITPQSVGKVLDVVNTGLLGGILLLLRNFMKGGNVKIDVGGGLFGKIKDTLDSVTGAMTNMQQQIKADLLLKIAAAIGILAASVLILSLIDPKKLAAGLTAMGGGFIALQFALKALMTSSSLLQTIKLPLITASLIALAAAMLLFSISLKILAGIDLGSLVKALLGVGAMLFILTKAVVPLSANAGGMIRAGLGLIAVGLALRILAGVVQVFATMSWADIGKGLGSIAAALIILSGAMTIMPKDILLTSAGLVILGAALNIIAAAVAAFAAIGWPAMIQGFTGMAIALGLIAAAMAIMPPNILLQAVALIALGAALNIIGLAIAQMGGMSIEQIAKGLVTLGASLLILAGGLALMTGTLPGAAALVITAGALMLLTPVLLTLGTMSWGAIVKGLLALAGAFTVIGIAGLVLTPLIPSLLGLGVALTLLGAGLALAGGAALAFATAFSIVVAAGSAGVVVLMAILRTIINSIPAALKAFGRGIAAFATAIAHAAPAFFHAFSAILTSMLNAVIRTTPKIGQAFSVLLRTALRIVQNAIPSIVSAGLNMMVRFLSAINRYVPRIVPIAVSIVTRFINGVANNIGRVIQAGVNLAIKFINGVANALNRDSGRLGAAGGNLAVAIVRGMAAGIAGGAGTIASAALGVARSALNAAKSFLGIHSPSKAFHEVGMYSSLGMAQGLSTYSSTVDKSAANVGKSALKTLKSTMSGVSAIVSEKIDSRPVITPVLDLSQAQKGAGQLGSMLTNNPISAGVSFNRASSISTAQAAAAEAAAQQASEAASAPKEVKFEQNNYSPKALSAVEIYRQTRNQISLAKEALSK